MFGVINLVTKTGSARKGARAEVLGGSLGTGGIAASYGQSLGTGLEVLFSLGQRLPLNGAVAHSLP